MAATQEVHCRFLPVIFFNWSIFHFVSSSMDQSVIPHCLKGRLLHLHHKPQSYLFRSRLRRRELNLYKKKDRTRNCSECLTELSWRMAHWQKRFPIHPVRTDKSICTCSAKQIKSALLETLIHTVLFDSWDWSGLLCSKGLSSPAGKIQGDGWWKTGE